MNKHTPGPWSLIKDGLPKLNNQNNIVYGSDGVAIVYGQANDADAQLIAAAPELLEACKLFLAYHDAVDKYDVSMMLAYADAEKAIRLAVAKAEGGAA